MNQLRPCISLFCLMGLLTGIVYPFILLCLGHFIMPYRSQGSMVVKGQTIVGSELIGQPFSNPQYFWPRPSSVDYNPLRSGGSNLSPTSATLKSQVDARQQRWKSQHFSTESVPSDLLFSSGSGLDPHISVEAAFYQVDRVAKNRNADNEKIMDIVLRHVEKRGFGFLGEKRVNVLLLNIALDQDIHQQVKHD